MIVTRTGINKALQASALSAPSEENPFEAPYKASPSALISYYILLNNAKRVATTNGAARGLVS
eukprot:scaffold4795_cov112-Cylindrotheca_fusiformis.AAC.2